MEPVAGGVAGNPQDAGKPKTAAQPAGSDVLRLGKAGRLQESGGSFDFYYNHPGAIEPPSPFHTHDGNPPVIERAGTDASLGERLGRRQLHPAIQHLQLGAEDLRP